MMFCVLTVVATMVSGETALVVGRRAGVSPSSAERLALAFHRVLTEQGTDVLKALSPIFARMFGKQ